MLKTKKYRGFTLIELLVVIAIIGILASIVLVSLSGAREKARDARRQSDVRQFSLAMEMYYDDWQAYYATDSTPGSIDDYLNPVPSDPQGDFYGWEDNSSAGTDNDQEYCFWATLEGGDFFAASHKGTREVTATTSGDCW